MFTYVLHFGARSEFLLLFFLLALLWFAICVAHSDDLFTLVMIFLLFVCLPRYNFEIPKYLLQFVDFCLFLFKSCSNLFQFHFDKEKKLRVNLLNCAIMRKLSMKMLFVSFSSIRPKCRSNSKPNAKLETTFRHILRFAQ